MEYPRKRQKWSTDSRDGKYQDRIVALDGNRNTGTDGTTTRTLFILAGSDQPTSSASSAAGSIWLGHQWSAYEHAIAQELPLRHASPTTEPKDFAQLRKHLDTSTETVLSPRGQPDALLQRHILSRSPQSQGNRKLDRPRQRPDRKNRGGGLLRPQKGNAGGRLKGVGDRVRKAGGKIRPGGRRFKGPGRKPNKAAGKVNSASAKARPVGGRVKSAGGRAKSLAGGQVNTAGERVNSAAATLLNVPPAVPPFPTTLNVPTVPAFPFPASSTSTSISAASTPTSASASTTSGATTATSPSSTSSSSLSSTTSTSTDSSTTSTSSTSSSSSSTTGSSSSSLSNSSTRRPTTFKTSTSGRASRTANRSPNATSILATSAGGGSGIAGNPTLTQTTATPTGAAGGGNGNASGPTPKIVGGVVGGLAGLALVLVLVLVLLRRYKKRQGMHALNDTEPGDRSMPETHQVSSGPQSIPAIGGLLGRITAKETTPGDTKPPPSFEKISGRKLPSAFSGGMEAGGPSAAGAAAASSIRPVTATQEGAQQPDRRSEGYFGSPGPEIRSFSPSEPSENLSPSPDFEKTLQPGPGRSPMVHHADTPPPSSAVGLDALSPPYTPRGTLGRSRPSMDGSRGSRFTEDV